MFTMNVRYPTAPMKNRNPGRLLSLTLEKELSKSVHDRYELDNILRELKTKERELREQAIATHDPRARMIIRQKQQIVHIRRSKVLALLREERRLHRA
jgi:hypothetical protein